MNDTSTPPAELVGLLWSWRCGDPLPALASPVGAWRVTASQRADAAPEAELSELMLRDFELPLAASARRFGRGYHLSDNIASQRGIARAGFQQACAVYATAAGALALRPDGAAERVAAGARLLGLPLLADH